MPIRRVLTALFLLLLFASANAQTFRFVKDLNTSKKNINSYPQNFTVFKNELWFMATDSNYLYQVYHSDGTTAGTKIIKKINPQWNSVVPGNNPFVEVGGRLFFLADDNVHGTEIWSTDGTDTGTRMLMDIYPSGSYYPLYLTVFKNKFYFSAYDSTGGQELWCSDGTKKGTKMFKDIKPGNSSSNPTDLVATADYLFFNADTQGTRFFRTDGTAAGTFTLFYSNASKMAACDSIVYFNSYNTYSINQVYKSDGTRTGTKAILGLVSSSGFYLYQNKVYFTASDGTHGIEPYVTNGSADGNGTILLGDIFAGKASSDAFGFTGYNGRVYFGAYDTIHGDELWSTDGTASGTHIVKDLFPGKNSGIRYLCPLVTYAGGLYYIGMKDSADGYQLVRTDGTDTGTHIIMNPYATNANPMKDAHELVEYKNALYFKSNADSKGDELWSFSAPKLIVTAMEEVEKSTTSVNIYPNPVNGNILDIHFENPAKEIVNVQLLSMDGKILLDEKHENSDADFTISIPSNIHNGLYLLSLKSAAGVSVKKLMIER